MNWKRIGTGAMCAGGALLLFDFLFLVQTQFRMNGFGRMGFLFFLGCVPADLVVGFLLSWLYVLARPRLGPGPKTAWVMGTLGFLVGNSFYVAPNYWIGAPLSALGVMVFDWLKFVAATYLAGWQYIEKAP